MQTIVEHFIRYEMFWQCSLFHSALRTHYVYVFEFMPYYKLKINLKAKSLAEDLYLVTREVKLISNTEKLIKWEFTIAIVSVTTSQKLRWYGNPDRYKKHEKRKENEKIQSKSK
jgi:hypothetical protein